MKVLPLNSTASLDQKTVEDDIPAKRAPKLLLVVQCGKKIKFKSRRKSRAWLAHGLITLGLNCNG